MTVRVFISWSGPQSKQFAEALRNWIPAVIQAARPYYSSDDITKGERWATEIAKELDASQVGIMCLTKDNLQEPWLLFEAGALSKNLGTAKVCPILFGLETTDLQGPLSQFQASKFNQTDIRGLMGTINRELEEEGLSERTLDSVFNKWWEDLESQVQVITQQDNSSEEKPMRSDRELLEEVLQLSRTAASRIRRPALNSQDLVDLVERLRDTTRAALESNGADDVAYSLNQTKKSVERVIQQIPMTTGTKESVDSTLLDTDNMLAMWDRTSLSPGKNVDFNEEDFDDIPF